MPKGKQGFQKGCRPWNKDKKGYKLNITEERRTQLREQMNGNQYSIGRINSDKQREAASKTMKNNWETGKVRGHAPWDKDIKIDRIKYPKMGNLKKYAQVSYKCIYCGKEFEGFKSSKSKFCSRDCWWGWFRENHPMKNSESRKKVSKSKKGKVNLKQRGNKHWNWKGGVSSITKEVKQIILHKTWRELIFKRDNYTCQKCGGQGCYLHPHHIKSYNILMSEFLHKYNQFSPIEDKETLTRLAITYEPFWDIDNGTTLCKKCHKEFHKLFGNKNNKEQIEIFFSEGAKC